VSGDDKAVLLGFGVPIIVSEHVPPGIAVEIRLDDWSRYAGRVPVEWVAPPFIVRDLKRMEQRSGRKDGHWNSKGWRRHVRRLKQRGQFTGRERQW
jgi:hypothetical protein